MVYILITSIFGNFNLLLSSMPHLTILKSNELMWTALDFVQFLL
ncbi:Uncharacterised protein [Rodentibacter pneumotropicus]|uniref:Uncharacterized protein n=1 Tax=Rodentibacter pneumotropicus TaxID=758 RepID=A0A3S4Y0F8_9PAST|nr:Uncharacterised protein [Rodentibacter pneumotropicus]